MDDLKFHASAPVLPVTIRDGPMRELDHRILCFDITYYSKTTQFLLCTAGVFTFYIIYGILQELIFATGEFQPYGLYLTFYQFFLYTLFAFIETRIEGKTERKIPLRIYILLSFLTVGTMAMSNSSLGYLNYPTQVIFKCCKLIPVLIGGILIQRKEYGCLDFSAAVFMSAGLTWFTLADSQVSPVFHPIGLLMISLALLCDALMGNIQEKFMKRYHAVNSEIVLYSYSIGLLYIGSALIITGQLLPSIHVCSKFPTETYGYGFLFSLAGYCGVNVVLTLVRTCDVFTAVTVTTFRKALTIALSFIAFKKPFTIQYLWAGLLVFAGIYINYYGKKHKLTFREVMVLVLRKVVRVGRTVKSKKGESI